MADYAAVLRDLLRKRAEIDTAITALRALNGFAGVTPLARLNGGQIPKRIVDYIRANPGTDSHDIYKALNPERVHRQSWQVGLIRLRKQGLIRRDAGRFYTDSQ